MSDHARKALKVVPKTADEDSRESRPLISLIVPVWNDDERVVELVSGLPVTPDLVEWVVAAVRPTPNPLRVAPSRDHPSDFVRQTLARRTNERRSRQSARTATLLSPRRFRVAS